MTSEIKFTQEEWRRASDLAALLLERLGPQKRNCCETCSPPRVLVPNYEMKYELAKALRDAMG